MAIKKSPERGSKPKREPELAAAEFVINPETGVMIHGKNMDVARDPASLTKLMTAYMAMRAVARGEVDLDKKITISAGAAQLDNNTLNIPITRPDGSKDVLDTLPAGTQMTLREALTVMMTSSANGVAKAIGEALAPSKLNSKGRLEKGSERDFAREMTRVARSELGMTSSSFINASGLNNGGPEQVSNLSTARDMATLASRVMQDFPQYEKMLGAQAATTRLKLPDGQKVTVNSPTTNHFVRDFGKGSKRADKEGFVAVGPQKTGFNQLTGGINLLATAQNADGVRLVSIVLGGKGSDNRYAANLKNLRGSFSRLDEDPRYAAAYTGGVGARVQLAALSPSSAFAETDRAGRRPPAAPRVFAQADITTVRARFNGARQQGQAREASLHPVVYRPADYVAPAVAPAVAPDAAVTVAPLEQAREALQTPAAPPAEVPAETPALQRENNGPVLRPGEI